MNERDIDAFFGDDQPKRIGTGWWAGVIAAFFGILAFGGVLCLHFPQVLSSPELRPYYPMPLIRIAIQIAIMTALAMSAVSALLRRKKVLALTGLLLATAALAWGGSSVPINRPLANGPAIGLDWFLIDLFAMTAIYVPLERFWPQYPDQGSFRPQWTLDIVYFLSTHLPIQLLSFLVLLPATQAARYLAIPAVAHRIATLPLLVQFILAVIVADLAEWTIHFALHKVPFLWRFHAIHHSSPALDWIAGSRSHFVDDTLVRGFILVPMMLAFSQGIILAYLVFVTLHATWTHCNFRPSVRWLEPYLVTPRYHHWHHSSQVASLDRNFAIHFPWIDRLFGTYYFPDVWPERYGLAGEEVPQGFVRQLYRPFIQAHPRRSEAQRG